MKLETAKLKLGVCGKCHKDIFGDFNDGYGYYEMKIVVNQDGLQFMYHTGCINKFKRMKFKRGFQRE